jgi:hypothetical protein
VLSCSWGMGYRCEGPVVAGRGEPVVLHAAVQTRRALPEARVTGAAPA